MKRILLITENLGSGGAERQLCGLSVLLKEKGYTVKVITYLKKQFYEPYLRENGVDYELHEELLNNKTRIFRLRKLVLEYNPDTIVSFLPSTNITICLLKIFCKKNIIVSERSHTEIWNLKTRIRYNIYRLANKIVANSVSEELNIKEHCIFLKKKTTSICNYVETNKFVPAVQKENHDVPQILCVGRLIPSKNILMLIDAAKILKSEGRKFKIIWVGKQYDKVFLKEVKKEILQYNLTNCITLKEQTSDIVKEYQNADIFCLPSSLEGYPNVVVEAMSCQLPILCSNVYENSSIIKNGVNGFLFQLNKEDIYNKIIQMLDLTCEERIEMGKLNRLKVLQNNSMEKFVSEYIKLL